MPFWVIALLFVASLVLGELLRPRIRDNSRALTLKDFNTPTATENRPIPVIWGTVKVDAPNITWYGDLQSVKLTKYVKTGLFKSDRITIGFRYSVGMEIALCHGPVDALVEVGFGAKSAWSGNVTGNNVAGETFDVDARTLFGGDSEEQLQNGGNGGVYAQCTFYRGIANQTSNSYLSNVLSTTSPGHSGVSYLVWNGPSSGQVKYNYDLGNPQIAFTREPFLSGYIGTSPNLENLWVVLRRLPNLLNNNYYNINNGDANPADVLLELLTNETIGRGLTTDFINIASFESAQLQLFNEGMGISGMLDTDKSVGDMIDEILKYIDGLIYTDLTTGTLTLKLARDDYDVNNLISLDESNISEVASYSSSSIDGTTNQVQLAYIDRSDKFKEKLTVAHDLANAISQEDVISVNVSYFGLSNGVIASRVANRDLRTLSYPLDKVSLRTNRIGTLLRPGAVFKLTLSDYNIVNKPFRVTRLGYGELTNGICEVDAVEDIFSLGSSVYSGGATSEWVDPVVSAVPPSTTVALELPYHYSQNESRLLVASAKGSTSQLSFNTYASIGTSTGTYAQIGAGDSCTPTGTLVSGYSGITSAIDAGPLTIAPSSPSMMSFLQNMPSDYIKSGNNLAYITDGVKEEFIAFESILASGNNYNLTNVWRGLLDTVPQSWSSGARVWFLSYGDAQPSQTYAAGSTVYVKVASVGQKDISSLSNPQAVVMSLRATKPYPPGNFRINGSTSTVNISAGSDIVVDWSHRNRLSQKDSVTPQSETGIAAEPGTEYYLKFFNDVNANIRTVGPLSEVTTTYTYTNANQIADNSAVEPKVVTVQLYSKRDGIYSLHRQQRTLVRPTGVVPATTSYSPGADSYTQPPEGNATSLGGIRVVGTPTNNQVLVYDSVNGVWTPANAASVIMLGGDVTGTAAASTVEKIRNRDVSANAPVNGQGLIWSASDNAWKPQNIASSTTANDTVVLTAYSGATQDITANNTWTDINNMSLDYSSNYLSSWLCTFSCTVAGISSNWEQLEFRAVLNNSINSEVWLKAKDIIAENNEKLLLSFHTVFENLAPNTTHNLKVQWRDGGGSNLDVRFYDRRLTAVLGKPSFDSSFTPDAIAELSYWFKANELVLNNLDPVGTLTDYSGNSRNFTAVTNSNRGSFYTNQLNSLPAVRFTHDGNAVSTTNTQYNGPNFLTGYTAGEIFVVIKAAADPANSNLKGAYATFGSDINITHFPFTNGDIYDDFGTSTRKSIADASIPVSLSGWHILNISSAANNWTARIDGTQVYNTSSNTVAWTTAPSFGGSGAAAPSGGGFDGYIAEIIFFSKSLNAVERLNVRAYLANKYAI